MAQSSRLSRKLTVLTQIVLLSITVVLPMSFMLAYVQNMLGGLEAEAELNAANITHVIQRNPDYWQFEVLRLEELLSRRPRKGHPEIRKILNQEGKVLVESADPLGWPTISRSFPLYESGRIVGELIIVRSLRSVGVYGGFVFFGTVILSVFLYWFYKIFSLKGILKTEEDLYLANEELSRELGERRAAERKKEQVQKQLLHSDRLASIGTLAAGVAHEINNPLSVIHGYIEVLGETIGDPTQIDFIKSILEKQKRAVQRIAKIVASLRTYARSDTDHVEQVDVHEVINDTADLFENIYKKSQITLTKELKATQFFVDGNVGKLQQVLVNLVANARDALESKEGDREVIIETENIEEYFVLRLKDNGCGMDSAQLQKMFSPFFTTKPAGKGTGLGLSICHSIIASFKGKITVDSKVGRGTTFIIILPVSGSKAVVEVVSAEAPKDAHALLRGSTVLLAEDESEVRTLLRHFLGRMGMQVEDVGDGLSAFKKLQESQKDKPYRFLITDIKMPELDGIGLIEKIVELGIRIHIVVITGGVVTDFPKERREIIFKHADGYLTKPFSQQSLEETLLKIVQES